MTCCTNLQIYSRLYSVYQHLSISVHLGLGKAGDLLGTVLDLAIGCLEAAQNAGALLDGVVARQLAGCNAVQSTVA